MNMTETGKILAVISEIYPSFRKDRNIEATAKIWQQIFAQTPYEQVSQALTSYIATDTKGFPPVPGALNDRIWQMRELNGMNENEAWSLVYKALHRSGYNSREEFDKLPEEIQRIVGHPSQLYEWAMLDTHEVSTVIASGFKRSWRARKEMERQLGVTQQPRIDEGKQLRNE